MSYFYCKVGCMPSFSCQEYAESLAGPSDDADPIRWSHRVLKPTVAWPWPGSESGAGRLALLPGAGLAGWCLCLFLSAVPGLLPLPLKAKLGTCWPLWQLQGLPCLEHARLASVPLGWPGPGLGTACLCSRAYHPVPWWSALALLQTRLAAGCSRLQAGMSEVDDCVASQL